MEINIDAEELQAAIVGQISKTVFGESIANAVKDALTKKDGYGINAKTIIERVAHEQVTATVARILDDEIGKRKAEFVALVREQLTDEVFREMTSHVIAVMTGRLEVR